jgi:hypothetical protein
MGNICSHEQRSTARTQAAVVPAITQTLTPVRITTSPMSKLWVPRLTRKSYHGPSLPSTIQKAPRQVPSSHSSDRSRAGFLNLPAELRNNIYAQVLIYTDYIRVMPNAPTKIPALVLLQICKQIHDEAASVFYAANSFYVQTSRHVKLIPGQQSLFPHLSETYLPTLLGGEGGGLVFPAPRYHLYLTRLTIDAKIFLPDDPAKFPSRSLPEESLAWDPEKLREELDVQLLDLFSRVRSLWEEKGTKWEGRLVTQEGLTLPRCLCVTMSFSDEEEDEIATRALWRRAN